MSILDKTYEKVKGAYFAFLALLAIGIGMLIALMIYLPEDPSFSISTNYISDLGVDPIGSRIVFSIGMILGAIFLILFFLYIARYLRQIEEKSQRIWIFLYSGLVAELGLIFIGIFPLDRTNETFFVLHAISAVIFFVFTGFSSLGMGYIEYKNSKFSKVLAPISILPGVFSLVFSLVFVIQEFSTLPEQPFVYLTEWFFFVFISIWLIVHGFYFWKKKE